MASYLGTQDVLAGLDPGLLTEKRPEVDGCPRLRIGGSQDGISGS